MENLYSRVVAFFGIFIMMGICLAVSTDRKAALSRWQLIVWGLGLQFVFGLLVLKTPVGQGFFSWFNDAFTSVVNCTSAGSGFVFGALASPPGDASFATVEYANAVAAGNATVRNNGVVFAFFVLSSIVFFSALTSILYHLGILQMVVKGIAWVMMRTMKTSGAETLSASANIFVGQTEAPLIVKPFLNKMTNSELMTVMTGGFATVAGGVMAAYVGMLGPSIPNIAGHLLAASIMSAPAALLFGKLMVPETDKPETGDTLHISVEKESVNVLDAAAIGTSDGVKLAINVAGMLVAFIALIALVDLLLKGTAGIFMSEVPTWLNLRDIVGQLFAPLAYILGITDWNEAVKVGQLLGVKMVANEFVAYLDLARLGEAGELSVRARIITAYALCGFANFGSIGIQIGGLAVIAPDRRKDLSRLALRAMFAGTLAANATGCVAAILI